MGQTGTCSLLKNGIVCIIHKSLISDLLIIHHLVPGFQILAIIASCKSVATFVKIQMAPNASTSKLLFSVSKYTNGKLSKKNASCSST